MRTLELLAPARNAQIGKDAIDHGADAVYIGAYKFGARAAAGNAIDDIADLCHYAHRFGAKVYATVNTIVYDSEMRETVEMVRQLQAVHVDAILLQDMGLLMELRKAGVDIDIHASTQTDNRTAEKVRWLAEMGIKRVVLARELSIEEVASIHQAVPDVDLEVFVHGALCVSYSGQCYASEHCFGRSANRGECAQFCRMAFTMTDSDNNVIAENRHLLSLKDMSQLPNLEQLALAGASSFKIEGRLKESDYVKNITAAYNLELERIVNRHATQFKRPSMGHCTYSFTPDISKSFNRGFTTYFAHGRQQGLASLDTPKALGEAVGRVKEIKGNSFTVASTAAFANGDGLCFFAPDHSLVGFRVNRADGNRLFPQSMPKNLRSGMPLYRNHDQAFKSKLARPSAERRVDVDMRLDILEDSITLSLTCDGNELSSATMPYEYQKAARPQEENIKRQLCKLGNTAFAAKSLCINTSLDCPFIANSVLTTLRRMATELTERHTIATEHSTIATERSTIATERSAIATERSTIATERSTIATERSAIANEPHALMAAKGSSLPWHYDMDYLYNAANKPSRAFYERYGVEATAMESDSKGAVVHPEGRRIIMQCRYCIRAEMGYCTKSGRAFPWKEPLHLRLDNGQSFTLKFNCKKCEMEIEVMKE